MPIAREGFRDVDKLNGLPGSVDARFRELRLSPLLPKKPVSLLDFQDSRHDSSRDEDALIGRALHQHKLHFSEVYGLRRDQSGRIFLKNDRLVFHKGE
jgi:hypothetical protein